MASWWVSAEIAEGIVGRGPSSKMPGSRLPVRPADLRAILRNERPDRCMAVHCLEQVQAGAVQPDERKVIIKRSQPPFVWLVLIGDEIRNVPGKEAQNLTSQAPGVMVSDSGFHGEQCLVMSSSSLQERSAIVQDGDRYVITETVLTRIIHDDFYCNRR